MEKAIHHISGSASAFMLDPELAGYANKRTFCARRVTRVDQMDDWTVLLFHGIDNLEHDAGRTSTSTLREELQMPTMPIGMTAPAQALSKF